MATLVGCLGCWFEDRAPDFAPTVEIHRKPGYDPAELSGYEEQYASQRLTMTA